VLKTDYNAKVRKKYFSSERTRILSTQRDCLIKKNSKYPKQNNNLLKDYIKNKKMNKSNINNNNTSFLKNNIRSNFAFSKNQNQNRNLSYTHLKRKMDKNLSKKRINRNYSRQNKMDERSIYLNSFNLDTKINAVHYKVNHELNNLFNDLNDNIVKDPEFHKKIRALIRNIKDIQQVVHRKTQTNFRPKKI